MEKKYAQQVLAYMEKRNMGFVFDGATGGIISREMCQDVLNRIKEERKQITVEDIPF